MPTSEFGSHFGLLMDSQYVAVLCPRSNTTVTLYDGANPRQPVSCSASGLDSGKAYFGAKTNAPNISAGVYLEANQPVYLMHEGALPNDEHNLMGLQCLRKQFL